MMELGNAAPVGVTVEEVIGFNLAAGAHRDGPAIDTQDWYGSLQGNYAVARASGFPFLDLFIRAPGSVQVILRHGVNTGTMTVPAITYYNGPTWGFLGGQVGLIRRERLAARFVQVRVLNTYGQDNNGIYLVYFVRSN